MDFGPATEGAVRRFQEAFQLPSTGVMDAATLLALADCHGWDLKPPLVSPPEFGRYCGRPAKTDCLAERKRR